MKRVSSFLLSICALMALGLGACGEAALGQGQVDPTGTHYGYVVDELLLPTTAGEATRYALDLDSTGGPDNQLGNILAALGRAADLDLNGSVKTEMRAGRLILLADVQATSLSRANGVGVWVHLGANPMPAACSSSADLDCGKHLAGGTSFDIAANSPKNALLVGEIVAGAFSGGPGRVTIRMSLDATSPPLSVDLIGARATIAQVGEQALRDGRLGGAISDDDVQNQILPSVHGFVAGLVRRDCVPTQTPCCSNTNTTGATLVGLFDANKDCSVDLDELRNSALLVNLLRPDLDLLDAKGNLNPNQDGVKESLSMGLAFRAITAQFAPPAP